MERNSLALALAAVLTASLAGSCADAPPPNVPSAADLSEPAGPRSVLATTDRDVLYVDDWGPDGRGRVYEDCIPAPPSGSLPSAPYPHDQCHDQFLREAIGRGLAAIGHPDWVVDRYEPLDPLTGELRFRPVEIDSTSNEYWIYDGPVTEEHLLRYKVVIWNVRSESTSQLRALCIDAARNHLVPFLDAGGELWIMGTGAFSRTRSEPGGVGLLPFGFRPEDFLYYYLNLRSAYEGWECSGGCFRSSGATVTLQRVHGFEGANADPLAAAEGFPDLRVSREPYVQPTAGIPSCEGMLKPFLLENPDAEGPTSPLYYYQSNARLQLLPPNSSFMDDAACALRYAAPGRGRIMVFGFPLYYMPESVDAVMTASLSWLLE